MDRFRKQRHLLAYSSTIDAKGFAELFIPAVFRLPGLPLTMVSDRGPQFTAAFWRCLCTRLGTEARLSSLGQTERFNGVMEQ